MWHHDQGVFGAPGSLGANWVSGPTMLELGLQMLKQRRRKLRGRMLQTITFSFEKSMFFFLFLASFVTVLAGRISWKSRARKDMLPHEKNDILYSDMQKT